MQNKIKTKVFAVIGLSVLGGVCLTHSDSVSAYSLTVSTSGSVTANVMPSADGGIGTTVVTDNVNIISNCRAGYTMTIAGPSDNNLYLNGDDTNNASGTYFTPVNGTSALNNSNNVNKWGYSLTANSKTGIFTPLSSTAATLKTPSQTASPYRDINTTIPIYYGTSVNSSMAPGSYTFSNSNSVTYSVVMDTSCTMYSIQYDGSNPDNPNGMGTTDSSTGVKSVKQINIAEDTKVTLLAPNFKKTGYGFLGWSTDQNAYAHFTDNDNTNDPIIYGSNEDVIVDSDMMAAADSKNIITMYAVWMPALKDGSNNTVYFQDWDNPNTNLPHDGCSTLTQTIFDDTVTDEKRKITATKNSVVALTDKRDNMVYAVARLADGNCWMTENLRLDNQYTMGQNQNDPSVTNQYLAQGYGGTTGAYGNFVGLAEPESTNFIYSTTPNSVYKTSAFSPTDTYDGNGNLEDIGSYGYPGRRLPRYNNSNTLAPMSDPTYTESYTNASSPSISGAYKTSAISSYGNYYNYAASVANTHAWLDENSSNSIGTSICPSGWHLPSTSFTDSADREFGKLSVGYGGTGGDQSGASAGGDIISNRLRSYPNNYVYSGYYKNSSAGQRGSNGFYWSRTQQSSMFSYNVNVLAARFNPARWNVKDGNTIEGAAVRCLVNPSEVEITLDSNNGTGAISRVYGAPASTVTLPSSSNPSASIAVLGHGFRNWNTARDGSGATYTSSYAIPAGSIGITLYAQWDTQYTITYVNNCMSWASSDGNCSPLTDRVSWQKINLANNPSAGTETGTLADYEKWTLTGWIIKDWNTNADGTGITYPVSSTYTVPSGSVAGDGITLYAHWVPSYTIQYDGNGADNASTGMGSIRAETGIKTVRHYNATEGDSFALFASNFKRDGYGFIGWSMDADAWDKLIDNDNTNNAKIWGPNELFVTPAYNDSPIITLYAVWVPAETSGGNPVYLQNWTGCSAMTATTYNSSNGTLTVAKNSVTALTDQRDNQVYAVAKLTDGNCCLMENLRLSDGGTIGNNINDSSITNQSLSEGYGGIFVGLASPETNFGCNTTSNSLYDSSNLSSCYSFPRYSNHNITWNGNSASATTPTLAQNLVTTKKVNFNNYVYSYGNYYTWAAAIADTTAYSSPNTHDDVTTSLCPVGWHLPHGGQGSYGNASGGFYYLANSMSATSDNEESARKIRSFPNNYVFSGSRDSSSGVSPVRGYSGYYWTTSSLNGADAWTFDIGLDFLDAGTNDYPKNWGQSVRCVNTSST
ncbi:MAG: InlB B-repeat-containing protein [Candidatus Saccharibacteria bacterium]|nr:InlB B-repeat-containing protein [Candidatus Saccharibacteria bacterium]